MAQGKYAKYARELSVDRNLWSTGLEGSRWHPVEYNNTVFPDTPVMITIYASYAPGGGIGCGNTTEVRPASGKKMTMKEMPHSHPFDEIFTWVGSIPNSDDLGGVHEFWMGEGDDAEKFIITKTTSIYIPKGVVHNPNYCIKCDKPYHMIVVVNSPGYGIEKFSDKLPKGFVYPYDKPLPRK